MSAGAGLSIPGGSAQSINKCLRNTDAGPGGMGGLEGAKTSEVRHCHQCEPPLGFPAQGPPGWFVIPGSSEGAGRGRRKQLLVSPLACLPAPLASHLATLLLRWRGRQRGRLSLRKGQLYHRADVGTQLEGVLGKKVLVGVVSCKLQRPQLEFRWWARFWASWP